LNSLKDGFEIICGCVICNDAWTKLHRSQATVQQLVKSREIRIKRGTAEEAGRLIDLFDKYRPERALLVAPHLHDLQAEPGR
jgi:hypothetical protein